MGFNLIYKTLCNRYSIYVYSFYDFGLEIGAASKWLNIKEFITNESANYLHLQELQFVQFEMCRLGRLATNMND